MAHTRIDVISTRNELLRLISKQRDIYAGAIANLDNTKRMLLMMGVDEPPVASDAIDAMVEKMTAEKVK